MLPTTAPATRQISQKMRCLATLSFTPQRVSAVIFLLSMLWRTIASSAALEALAQRSAENLRINLGDEGQWLKELSDLTKYSSLPAKSRQKRIVPIELPRGLSFELKWNIDFTLYTYARFGMDLQLAILNDMFYPREFGPVQENFSLVELIPDVYKPFVQKPPRLFNKDEFFGDNEEEEEEMERRRYQVLHRKKREAHRDREIFYGVLEKYIDEYGMPARPCLLRTICELAEVPLQDDLFGKLVTTIFSPSRSSADISGETYDEYLTAELHGQRRGSCAVQYGDCPASMFDVMPFFEHNFVY